MNNTVSALIGIFGGVIVFLALALGLSVIVSAVVNAFIFSITIKEVYIIVVLYTFILAIWQGIFKLLKDGNDK